MEYAYRVWHTKKQVPTFYAGFRNFAIASLILNHFEKLAALWKDYIML